MTAWSPLPRSLVGRTLLVLIVGLVLSQMAGVVFFALYRVDLAERIGQRQIAERVAAYVQLMDATPAADRPRVLRAASVEGLHVRIGPVPMIRDDDDRGEAAGVRAALASRFPGREIHATARPPLPPPRGSFLHSPGDRFAPDDRPPRDARPPRADGPPPFPGESGPVPPGPGFEGDVHPHGPLGPLVHLSIRLDDGTWLNVLASRLLAEPWWRLGFLIPLGTGFLVVTVLSVLAVRRATRPLAVLAGAAERLGRDVGAPPVPLEGPVEVRAAAAAFNEMQGRLKRFIDDRTQMIAAISHDLRTPITRLKLRAEFVDDAEQRDKMLVDLDEMEMMIAQTLAFARDDAAREVRAPADLAALLAELCADFGATYAGPESLELTLGVVGIKRAFANILENARKYGGSAVLTVTPGEGVVTVTVDDHGPGIPDGDLERVFLPFVRVEPSRNRDTGGTGLGLGLARTAIRAHGGDLVLANRPEGGLRVTATLPG